MTCIVGVRMGGKIILAGDTLGSNGYTGHTHHSKVIDGPNWSIGYSDSYRAAEIIEDKVLSKTPRPLFTSTKNVREFSYKVQEAFEKFGRVNSTSGSNKFPMYSTNLMIASPYGLWYLQSDLVTFEVSDIFACGSGGSHAEAAMAALLALKQEGVLSEDTATAKYVATKGIEVADKFVVSVNNDIWFREFTEKPRLKVVKKDKEEEND